MANNKITLTFEVTDQGTLKLVTKDANATAKAVSGVAVATDSATNAIKRSHGPRNAYNKLEKGTAQLTNNSTKAFAKQSQTLGGLVVPIYATLAANIFALTAAFGALQRAAAFKQLEEGLVMVGAAAGTNLPKVAKGIVEITGAAVSMREAMSAVAMGTSAQFSTEQIEGLAKVAKGASLALGRDLNDAMSRLIRGAAKLEPEILDELGIMVRLDTATIKYAASVGKAVSQLTQFERRQAFVTEILDQGLDKFGDIAESIEVNPYDKLSASLSNLTRELLEVVNKGLVPLINILAKAPTAIAGMGVMYGGHIFKRFLPEIGKAIEETQRLSAANLYLARTAEAKQKALVQKNLVGAGSVQVVQGYKTQQEFMAKTIRTEQDYKLAIQQSTASIATREKALARWRQEELVAEGKVKIALREKIAIKEQELAQVKRYKQHLLEAKAAELGGPTSAVLQAKQLSAMATRQGLLMGKIADAGAIQGFGIAIAGAAKQWQKAKFELIPGVLGRIGLGFTIAANGAKLFGFALLKALPFLGMILTIGSLLWPLISKLWNKGVVAKETNEVTKSFKSFNEVAGILGKTLESNKTIAEKSVAALRAHVGIINQVIDGLKKVEGVRQEAAQEKLLELTKERIRTEKELQQTTQNTYMEEFRRSKLKRTGEAIDTTKQESSLFDKVSAEVIIGEALTRIQSMEAPTRGALSKVEKEFASLLKLIQTDGITTFDDLIKKLLELNNAEAKIISSVDSMKEAYQQFSKELTALRVKAVTPFDRLQDSLISLKAEMRQAFDEGGLEGLRDVMAVVPEFAAELDKYSKNAGFNLDNALATAEEWIQRLETARKIDIEHQGIIKGFELQQRRVASIADDNSKAAAISLDLEIARLNTKLKQVSAQQAELNNIEAQGIYSAEIASLEQEISSATAERAQRIRIVEIKEQQRLLDYSGKLLATEKERLSAALAISKAQLDIRASAGGGSPSAFDSFKLFQQEKTQRLDMIDKELELKIKGVQLEYDLLEAQIGLEKIKADQAGLQTTAYDKYIELLKETRGGAIASAIAQANSERVSITAEGASAQEAVIAEEIRISNEGIANAVERYKTLSYATLGAQKELEANQIKQVQLRREITLDLMNGLDITSRQLELDQAQTEELKIKLALIDVMATRASRLAGDMFGMFSKMGATLGTLISEENFKFDSASMEAIWSAISPTVEALSQLGPEGEVMQAVIAGSFAMTEAFTLAFEQISTSSLTAQTALQAVGASLGAISSIQAAQSRQAIAGIDREIEAEKRRDGKSRESIAKIAALEKKKEATQKKAFEQNKKMMMAQTVIATATAVMQMLASGVPPANFIMAGLVAAIGAAQLGVIAGTSYEGGGAGGSSNTGPTSLTMGQRSNTVDLARSTSPSGELAYMRGERGTGTGASNYIPAGAFTGRSMGGNAGLIVGEQGPELFIPQRAGTILPADETAKVSSNSVGVTFNINAIDTRGMEEALSKNRGKIIGMIREAANSRGEFFLEGIN